MPLALPLSRIAHGVACALLFSVLNGCGATPTPALAPASMAPPSRSSAPSANRCSDFALDADRTWSSSTRTDVHAGILSVGGSVDSTIADRVVTKMDGISRSWVMMQESVCKDCVERRVLSEEAYSKISICLRTALVSQQVLASSLHAPTADQVFHADQSLAKIADDLKSCQHEAVYSMFAERADDPSARQVRSYLSRAQVLKDLGSLGEARDEAQKARNAVDGLPDPKLFTDTIVMQARIAWDMGEYDSAHRLAQRAAAEATAAGYELGQAGAWHILAFVFSRNKSFDDAFSYAERGLAVRRRLLGDASPETAISLSDLGVVRYDQERYSEALGFYQKAYATLQSALGDDHPRTVSAMIAVASTHEQLNDHRSALLMYFKALMACKKTLGLDHPNTADVAEGIGVIGSNVKLYPLAYPMFGVAAFIRNKVYGEKHPLTVQALENLKWVCDQGYTDACNFSPSAPDAAAKVQNALNAAMQAILQQSQEPTQ